MGRMINWFRLNTVRKKIFILSKLTGGLIVILYLATANWSGQSLLKSAIWIGLITIIILFLDVLLGRLISSPLNEINRASARMARLDLTARCHITTDDEFGELCHNLNTMSDNLKTALDDLAIANQQLAEDIDQKQILLSQRKELVDNLSHEMKTPLGIIQAYAESLQDTNDERAKKEYIRVILSASARMNDMLVALLDLSAWEAGAIVPSEEMFDFVDLVETVAGRLLIDVPDKTFTLSYDLPDEALIVRADRHRMEQVLTNLITNAKNHTLNNGQIHVQLDANESDLHFSIYNQGNPIPDNELNSIWQKFYRGQAREGAAQPGSGLGLAIVAQILSFYQAEYGVTNLNDGVEFYFNFPLA